VTRERDSATGVGFFREVNGPSTATLTKFVDTYRDRFDVETICAVIGFPPSTYYAAGKRAGRPSRRAQRDAELIPLIRQAWEDSNQLYGARKVWK
jgi:hypothetical protein